MILQSYVRSEDTENVRDGLGDYDTEVRVEVGLEVGGVICVETRPLSYRLLNNRMG